MIVPRRLMLALALGCAVVAGLAYYFDQRRVPVLVAAHAIASESAVAPGDLALVELPLAAVPVDALADAAQAVGRVARTAIAPGQFVLASAFDGEPGFRSGIRPPPGWRAVALPVSPATALGGAVVPGMRVDVVAVSVGAEGASVERLATGLVILDVRSEVGGPFAEPGSERGAFANVRLGSVIVAVPPDAELRFAGRVATSTFVLFRSP